MSTPAAPLSRAAWIMLLVWPVFVAALGGFVVFQYFKAQLVVELSGRPPVVVISEAEYVRHFGMPNGITQAHAAAAQLRNAGFLVLDVNQTYATPSQIVVQPK